MLFRSVGGEIDTLMEEAALDQVPDPAPAAVETVEAENVQEAASLEPQPEPEPEPAPEEKPVEEKKKRFSLF